MLPYVLTDSCFFHAGFLRLSFLFKKLNISTIFSSSGCLSGSTRSRIQVSGHLPPALKHEGERFSDQRKKRVTEPSSLLFQYWSCLSWQLCQGSERPDVMAAPSHCSPGTVGQRQDKHMTSVLCGAEPAQWLETTAPTWLIIAHWGGIPSDPKKKKRQKKEWCRWEIERRD